jgi:tellurite resistance protein
MITRLTTPHLDDLLRQTLDLINGSVDAHTETNRDVTATIKIKLKFDKERCRSVFLGAAAVDIPDGDLDSEIKRIDGTTLCTLHSDDPGQERIAGT